MTQRPIQPESIFDVDAAINECLDLEAAGRPDELRDLLAKARAEDSAFDAKLLQTRAAVGPLRRPPLAPDVSREVLTEVDYLRPFLSPRRRRQVSSTRVAVAAAAVITLSFMGLMQRLTPHPVAPQPTVDGMAMTSGADPANTVGSIASAINDLRTPPAKPAAVGRPQRWDGPIWSGQTSTTLAMGDLAMGDTSRYEGGLNWSVDLTLTPARSPLLDYHASEGRLALAQMGWRETPMAMSFPGGGLIELARSSSMISRLQQQERATLDLSCDPALSTSWSGRTDFERLFGHFEGAKANTDK